MSSDALLWLVVAAVAGALVAVWWRRRRGGGTDAVAARIDRMAAAGQLGAAGKLAADSGRLDVAFELYVRGKDLASAAAIAIRRGDLRRAATLCEHLGDWAQAIELYDRVGLHTHADTLRQTKLNLPAATRTSAAIAAVPATRTSAAIAAVPATRTSAAIAAVPEPRTSAAAPQPFTIDDVAPAPGEPLTVAMPADAADAGAPAEPPPMTRAAASALLADGDITAAAELFGELGLDDEATHLWVNVLGEPARAAPLYAARGEHQRAAELYVVAGDVGRAALAWVDAARASPHPELFLERIADLSPEVALRYLEPELATRPLSATTAEWHYHKARAVDRAGDARRAITLYLELREELGSYRDLDRRLDELTRAVQPVSANRTRRTSRQPIELPPEPPAGTPSIELPAPAPSIDLPAPAALDAELDQLHQLAAEVADAAVENLRRRSKLPTLPSPRADEPAARPDEAAVDAARRGPTLATLQQLAGRPTCDLGNIEVFYRIGLLHQAAGNFDDAIAAFDAVNDASPGYRDAERRADDLRAWKAAPPEATAGVPTGDDRYQLRGELGKSRIAVVYRAHDRQLDRDVALKLLSAELSSRELVREQFHRRATAAGALGHPNLVAVHDTGMLAGRAFVSMELVDGQRVDALMREPGGLSIVESLRIMKQVLDGLGCLHGHGLLHHDVRPASIMRTASGLVKLMDPGVTVPRGDGQPPAVIGGNPAYLAPELVRGGAADVDARADLFAASVSLFEMLARVLPYPKDGPPVRLGERVAAVPAPLEAAIMRGLALDRDQRWRSAGELGAKIGTILHAVNSYVAGRRRRAAVPPA